MSQKEKKLPIPAMAVALAEASMVHIEAFIKVMKELGKTREEAIDLWAWGLGISPVRLRETKEAIAAKPHPANTDPTTSLMMTLALNKYLELTDKVCDCPIHKARAKAVADPANEDQYLVEAIFQTSKKDPGEIIAEIAKEMDMSDEDMKQIYKTASNPSDPINIVVTMIRFKNDRTEIMEKIKTTAAGNHAVN